MSKTEEEGKLLQRQNAPASAGRTMADMGNSGQCAPRAGLGRLPTADLQGSPIVGGASAEADATSPRNLGCSCNPTDRRAPRRARANSRYLQTLEHIECPLDGICLKPKRG